jgi:hypothetical protein
MLAEPAAHTIPPRNLQTPFPKIIDKCVFVINAYRAGLAAAIAAVLCMEGPAKAAHYYPWCEYAKVAGSGNPKCQFATLEQCVADVFRVGGNCGPSPYPAEIASVN